MSVFRIYRGANDARAEYRGTRRAGAIFATVFNATVQPRNIFENLIVELIDDGCQVTYNPSVDPDGPEYPVTYEEHKHRNIIYYTTPGGEEFALKLRSEQDDPTDNKVSMAVPSRPVEYTDAYLARAVGIFTDTTISNDDKQKFLLGMLLLKRCR